MTPQPDHSNGSGVRRQATAWALASNFSFGVLGMGAVGFAVERWLWPASAPWMLLASLALGLFGGGYVFIRDALRLNRDG